MDALDRKIRIFRKVKKQALSKWFEYAFAGSLPGYSFPHLDQRAKLFRRHKIVQLAIGMLCDPIYVLTAVACDDRGDSVVHRTWHQIQPAV